MERQRKRELRDLNSRAWAGDTDVFPIQASLDSNLKKNTAFIKRLRTSINQPGLNTFIQETRSLSLRKYVSEIVSACYEGLCKLKAPADIAAGVEIVSALHQRFGPAEFTGNLHWFIGRGLSTPERSHLKALTQDVREREEKERLTRQRILLRVATELWLVDVLRTFGDATRPEEAGKVKDGSKLVDLSAKAKVAAARVDNFEPFPLEVLKDLLGHDREHVNLPLVVIFVKTFAWDILGVKYASEGRKAAEDTSVDVQNKAEEPTTDEESPNDPPFTNPELRQLFKNVLLRYFEDAKTHLVRDQKQLVTQSRRNAEAYVRSGEVFEDRQANYERQVKAQERLMANAQVLADVLGAEMPDLKEKDTSASIGDGTIGIVKAGDYLRGQGEGPGIWEDEDERRFYENLVELKDRVPGILLEETKKKKADDDQVGKKAVKPTGEEVEKQAEAKEADELSTAIQNKSVGAQVNALLARLPELTSKEAVDEVAIDFCFLNSKASRNRLIKAVEEVPKGRSDLLPLYSRLVATLGKHMPDISQGLVSYLDDEFRSLQRRKTKDFLGQVRTQNIRYLAELTKFGVVPEHVIFHCLKVSLDDFSRMNIEIISNLLENCGRYLLRNPETSPRMASFLETLQRKKSAQHLGQQERMLVENAIYYVNPPERGAIEQKERTPIDMFVRKMIYVDLNRRSMEKICKQIRKLHWEEPEVVNILQKIFTKPHKIKYINIHLLAASLECLKRHHQDFVCTIIDDILELITFGLELNDFKYNQRRIAEVKYLAELYVYKLIDSPIVFDTLYRICTYGHENGVPKPATTCPLDLPDDYFRIRLVCTILETCGEFYNKGTSKKKLDFFLTFFQYYIQTKEPLPMDIDFLVQDTFLGLRPQWKLLNTFEEANKAFADAVKQNYQAQALEKSHEAHETEDSASDDGADDEDGPPRERTEQSSGEETEDVEDEAQDAHSSEDEQIVVTRQENERDPEADADFDRELAKLMADSLDSRKFERKPMFDVPLPMRRSQKESSSEEPQAPAEAPNFIKFSLLSKRGNKQQTRQIDLPADSTFAVAMRTQQQAEKEEQQRIKNLVLNYDLRDENEGPDGLEKLPQNPYTQPRLDKAGNTRSNQRARKLQLSDVDWT
ncbi:ARM repeat-containing protein [Trichodelitschia bisporula]|uniref:ARM repeat-containing protein n=1 Tax=Trichodelitschia bisporula TaxID=703511 RepID=A0A6G1I1D8_9PEZI|nr:ARM repeat-containing protein [Trichodelitschia bisporula]